MSRVTTRRRMTRVSESGQSARPDTLVVEEPFEIRVDGVPLTVTMRTPGHDIDLVHGFLLSEGIIQDRDDVVAARYCAGSDDNGRNTYNILDVRLRHPVPIVKRSFLTTSACGLCGKTALDEVRAGTRFPIPARSLVIDAATLSALPSILRSRQAIFDSTGGLHAAGLFTADGTAVAVREDVGRHNAVDKVIGWALREHRMPGHDLVLIVSGRASFELVQKTVMAGIPVLGAVSAPSSLAVDMAAESGLTLAGFLRGETMNIYTGEERIAFA
ncbi:formate dehydrogenase accessory sulfurtransferase FdhD [Nocardia pneumoniae]|uniref:formate dehydrogenase accessory sulfurtransferase FdhD n=1 Tax=Nocardia pneumoniae TaxID=228601 RepID=UPI0002E13558|nr:formate dehydrogenase accessory sulfurtransferase FdhD [Nocardia pneumoniae]